MRQKISLLILVLLGSILAVQAQKIGDITFNKLPQDFQLVPRASTNLAAVPVTGAVTNPAVTGVSVRVLRNGVLFAYTKPALNASKFSASVSIRAELAEYDFEVYALKGADSSLVVKRKAVVAGDVYYVSGQSNAWIGPIDDLVYQGEWVRSFGQVQANANYGPYVLADTLWSLPIGGARIGPWAAEVAKQLYETEKVPMAFISSAAGGSDIDFHLILDGASSGTITGGNIMYYKALKSGTISKVRGIIFRQGEAEVAKESGTPNLWGSKFLALKEKWKKYFPSIEKIFLPQLNIYEYRYDLAAISRENQRLYHSQDPMIRGFATVGTIGFDRLHYSNDGYRQTGKELARIMLKELYGRTLSPQIYSPNIQRAYFNSKTERDKLYLEFEEGQEMVATLDTTIKDEQGNFQSRKLGQNFFWDDYNSKSFDSFIKKIEVDGRKVILTFKEPYDRNVISYLPDYHRDFETNLKTYPFAGPFLKNKLGMRAFAFTKFPVGYKDEQYIEYSLYPNPASDFVNIQWSNYVDGVLEIFSMSGLKIYSQQIEGVRSAKFPITSWARGNYFVQFTGLDGRKVTKRLAVN
jgi:hypothetical protein